MTEREGSSQVWLHCWDPVPITFRRELEAALSRHGIDACPSTLNTPARNGIVCFQEVTGELLEFIQQASGQGRQRVVAVAISPASAAGGSGWRLLDAGASDVIIWDPALTAATIAIRIETWRTLDELLDTPLIRGHLIGSSPAWIAILRQVIHAAGFTDSSILILGETGTGKELVARLIHSLDDRPDKRDLVVVDCTTIVPELSGSEFFGHERGAFTGALAARDGAFALAGDGTLFLDEVGDLPLPLQAQLLRVIQEHTYKRVGGNTWHEARFRLICATNRDLAEEVGQGQFRRDLFYRIAGWTFTLPPLRHRTEDILALARHFLVESLPGIAPAGFDEAVKAYLLTRSYPGNVRDLQQLIRRVAHRHVGPGPITIGDIPEDERPSISDSNTGWRGDEALDRAIRRALAAGVGLKDIGRAVEEMAVNIAVGDEQGNLQKAARKLGVTDRALQMRKAARRLHHGSTLGAAG